MWPDKDRALAEIAGVLKPGEDLLLSIRDCRTERHFERPGKGAATAEAAAEMLKAIGLQVHLREIAQSSGRATLLVRGRKCGRAERD